MYKNKRGVQKIMILQKLTKQSLKNFKNESDNALTKYVCRYIINHCEKGVKVSDFIENILKCGCASGIVGELVYYHDTLKFYKKFQHEIVDLLNNLLRDCDCSTSELFGDKWDKEDPLACEEHNQNLLAWFGFEETMHNIANEFGIE